jgi:hypothetical protein
MLVSAPKAITPGYGYILGYDKLHQVKALKESTYTLVIKGKNRLEDVPFFLKTHKMKEYPIP